MRAFLVSISVVLLGAGLTQPALAGRAAQALAAVAIVAVAAAIAAPRVGRVPTAVATPFAPPPPPSSPSVETPDVTEIVRAIEESKGVVPPLVVRQLAEIARGRLADHHRLNVERERDRPAIAALLSTPMRAIVLPDERDDAPRVPIRALPRLLDELEAL